MLNSGSDVNRRNEDDAVSSSNEIPDDTEGAENVLFHAVQQRNNESVVRALIDDGADVNITDNEGKTALFYAVQQSNNESVVRALIDARIDVNKTDNEGKTALFYAVQQSNNESMVRALIAAGADVKIVDKRGKTALFYAVQEWSKESMVRTLIAAGADVNIVDKRGKTAFFYAVQQSNNESVVRALIDDGADVNITDNEGKTALFYAIQQRNNESVVRALIECPKINVDARNDCGRTPLFYAVTKSLELAKLLIAKGANLRRKDSCDVSILSFFIEDCILNKYDGRLCDMTKTLAFLMEQGVKRKTVFKTIINVVFCQMFKALLRCNMFQNVEQGSETMKSLCEVLELAKNYVEQKKEQESINLINETLQQMRNEVPVHVTIDRMGAVIPNILELLIKLGANPNSADCEGNTSIHFLAQLSMLIQSQETIHNILTKLETSKRLENIRKLQNHQHETPFSHVFSLSSAYGSDQLPNITVVKSICEFLLKHGSSVEETSRTGRTAFHWIVELIRQVLTCDSPKRKGALTALIQMFELFASQNITKGVTVNQKDARDSLNTPLHLWASLNLGPGQDYSSSIADGNTFESILSKLLNFFLKSGAQLSSKNKNDETPLHLCRTWCAFKFLLKHIKDENKNFIRLFHDKDSSESQPLLTAAKSKMFHEQCFFPDLAPDPKEFFKTVIENDLDLWAVDKEGDSVMSVLIQKKSFVLAETLVNAVVEKNKLSSTTAVCIINSMSREITTEEWNNAISITENILTSIKSYLHLESAFESCCTNIKRKFPNEIPTNQLKKKMMLSEDENGHGSSEPEEPPRKRIKREATACNVDNSYQPSDATLSSRIQNPVHWEIAQRIFSHNTAYGSAKEIEHSFQGFVKQFPWFEPQLRTKSETLPWVCANQRYKSFLEEVARNEQFVERIDKVCYHTTHLGKGSFSSHKFYAGIGTNDGREVAVQRLLKTNEGKNFEKGIQNETEILIRLQHCPQIIKYYFRIGTINPIYLAMELMEGNIDDYFDGKLKIKVTNERNIKLIKDLLKGVEYMHNEDIIHCNLNPKNLLLKLQSEREQACLKITGFGFSRKYRGGEHRTNNVSSALYVPGPKTMKIFLARELLPSTNYAPTLADLSKKSDMFACSLNVYYISSKRGHPFSATGISSIIEDETTINNIKDDKKVKGWAKFICPPEAKHMMKEMFQHYISQRPSAKEVLKHPLFWHNEKKKAVLKAVARQKEFADPNYSNQVERKLQKRFSNIVERSRKWNDSKYYSKVHTIYEQLKKWREYDVRNVADLVRLFRNACEHFKQSNDIVEMDVFFSYFPNLLIEVYDVVIECNWHHDREDIKSALN